MSIYEYDFEKHMRQEREESYEDGYQDGEIVGEKKLLCSQIQKKLSKGKSIPEIADELEESVEVIAALIEELS